MSPERVSRLFHGVVVVGAALGCGGQAGDRKAPAPSGASPAPSEADPAPSDSRVVPASMTPATFPLVPRPDDCEHPEQFSCESFTAYEACAYYGVSCEVAACSCDASRPASPDDCEHPQQFRCEPDPYVGSVVGCECAPVAAHADDCEYPQQFQCYPNEPDTTCICNPNAPLDPTGCPAAQTFSCQSYDPPTDCRCVTRIILR